jgi:sugar (pentulose or hexulose) kinase
MDRTFVIGIDSSTTGCKAIAWDRHGRACAEGRAAYPLLQPAANWYEQDAEQWWRGTCAALAQLLSQIDTGSVEAVCVTHQRESFVPVDERGSPLRNAVLWLDQRSHAQVKELKRSIGGERFHQITGKPLTTNPSVSKILWLVQHEPEVVDRTGKMLDAHAFLIRRLAAVNRTSLASADPMGLVDMRKHTWSAELIHEIGLAQGQFTELVPPGAIIGHVTKTGAAQTGLPAGLSVVAGAGDGQCAGLGVNALGGGRVSLNLGTAVVSGTVNPGYLVDRAFRTLYAPLAGKFYLETVIQGGVFTVSWFLEKFASDLSDASAPEGQLGVLEKEAAGVPPGALGLVLVPYWNNALTPYWDPAAAGITIGWTGVHAREHFFRAVLEGLAFEQRLVGDGLAEAMGAPAREYVALGGGSRSDLLCQIAADVTGIPVLRATTSEATCLGAGILAATAVGWYSDAERAACAMTSTDAVFAPDAERHAFYDRLFQEVYRPLFPTLQGLIKRLTALNREQGRS